MNKRIVVLTGTVAMNLIIGNVYDYEQYIKDFFNARGWDVIAVRLIKDYYFSGVINISIELNLYDNFTAEQARAAAVGVLNSIPNPSWLPLGQFLLSNVKLQILSDAKPLTTNKDETDVSNIGELLDFTGDLIKDTAKGAAENPLTPIALVGGAIVIILLLKK